MRLEIHRSARAELNAAAAWYARRDMRVGMRFAAEAERGLTELLAHPLRWPEHLKNTRRYRFPGFPYALIYRATRARLRVIAVPHDHQAPGYWQRRR